MHWSKKVLFYGLIVLINMIFIEILAFAALLIYSSSLNKSSKEDFYVGEFAEIVADSRIVTMRKNTSFEVSGSKREWSIFTDEIGARVPGRDALERLNATHRKFIFIGDSVPFGVGVNAEDSIPFLFYRLNRNYRVINGAVPSYSLRQAVARFEKEFSGLEGVEYVYLQIYDPASQYANFGGDWTEDDNWTTFHKKILTHCKMIKSNVFGFLNNTNTVEVVNKLYRRLGFCKFKPQDDSSDKRYVHHIQGELHTLMHMVNFIGAGLIVAPVTPNPKTYSEFNRQYLHAIDLINQSLESEAKNIGYEFIDTRAFLASDSDFIDRCCHLSRSGAEKVAVHLNDLVNQRM